MKEQPGSVRETPSSDRSIAPGTDREIGISHSHSLSQFVAGKPKKTQLPKRIGTPKESGGEHLPFCGGPGGI